MIKSIFSKHDYTIHIRKWLLIHVRYAITLKLNLINIFLYDFIIGTCTTTFFNLVLFGWLAAHTINKLLRISSYANVTLCLLHFFINLVIDGWKEFTTPFPVNFPLLHLGLETLTQKNLVTIDIDYGGLYWLWRIIQYEIFKEFGKKIIFSDE